MSRDYCLVGVEVVSSDKCAVKLPLYRGYNYNTRWPLPFMIIEVPNGESIRRLIRVASLIRDELNVKALVIRRV